MRVLISNDDGINSKGMLVLAERLSMNNDVLVVAPDGNRSACSHSLTLLDSVKLQKQSFVKFNAYSLSGTPADCVKFAKLHFKEFVPDVVVSGINRGHNLGSDILYSGTVAIACEAAFFGDVAFAFSAYSLEDNNYDVCAYYAEKIINTLFPISRSGDIWNINFPDQKLGAIKGVKITKLGKQLYTDRYVEVDENEYRLVGNIINHDDNDSDCDIEWIKKGYVTITPILLNKTNYKKMEELKGLCIKL